MDDLLSEKEQIEQFRSWWKTYGAYVIGGLVVGAAMIFGWSQYQGNKLQAQLDASTAYEELLVQIVAGDLEGAEVLAGEIQTTYSETTYAGQSGLAMARLHMDKNRDQDAADALTGVMNSSADAGLKQVARIRLARIYLYQDNAEEVVALLANEDNAAFAATANEVLGDAYTALGQFSEADAAYQQILIDPDSQRTVDHQLVQWKSLDLPDVSESDEPDASESVESEDRGSEEVE